MYIDYIYTEIYTYICLHISICIYFFVYFYISHHLSHHLPQKIPQPQQTGLPKKMAWTLREVCDEGRLGWTASKNFGTVENDIWPFGRQELCFGTTPPAPGRGFLVTTRIMKHSCRESKPKPSFVTGILGRGVDRSLCYLPVSRVVGIVEG